MFDRFAIRSIGGRGAVGVGGGAGGVCVIFVEGGVVYYKFLRRERDFLFPS